MGGPGSGQYVRWDTRQLTTDRLALRIRSLRRDGLLLPGYAGTSRWLSGDRIIGSLGFFVRGDGSRASAVRLTYRHDGKRIQYDVPLDWTPCHFGGYRPWFVCPSRGCGRRVAVLYGGTHFLCRHCHQLVHESTRESALFRHTRGLERIRERLGDPGSIFDPFPSKPKGMHWETYWRLQDLAEERRDRAFAALVARLCGDD